MGLEGIVSKRIGSRYVGGRTSARLKSPERGFPALRIDQTHGLARKGAGTATGMLRSRRFSASRTRGREHGRGLVPAAAKAGLNYPPSAAMCPEYPKTRCGTH